MIIIGDKTFKFVNAVLLGIILLIGSISTQGQQLAFPGAEGFGKYATGGRDGIVLKVTNLDDSGEGSLRWAIGQNYPRLIVFEVSGTIYLKSRLKISYGNVTIAGQTAPGHGITLAHYNFYVEAENVIIRYIRSRLSAEGGQQDDAFNCIRCNNVIVDHCSFSWSVDEVASTYDNKNFTMQNCIIAESFNNSIHEKGAHGYGGIWGGQKVTFFHNLIMHHTSRNPRFCGSRYTNQPDKEHIDHRNNVIYNWGGNSSYAAEGGSYNIVNNYYKYGPATGSSVRDRIISPNADDGTNSQPAGVWGNFYVNGNYVYGSPEVTTDNWLGVDNISSTIKELIKSDTAFASDITTIQSAEEAYDYVIKNVGVTIPYRDTVDRRLVWEVENNAALLGNNGIVDNLDDVGGYPELFSDWVPTDSDGDCIPDFWELENGLDINNPDDNQTIIEGKTYPAIEEYINSIVASNSPFIYQPTNLHAELTDIKEIQLLWDDNTDEEIAYLVWRSEGNGFSCIDTLPANSTFCSDTNLVFDKTYTYKLQAISESDSSVFSNNAIASTLGSDGKPKPADNPNPSKGLNSVSTTVNLSWTPGVGAKSHDVYLGTTSTPVFVANVKDANYTLSNLKYNTRYYWRIDEVNEGGATTGSVWNFMTRNAFPRELIAHFSFNQPISVNDVSGNGITGTPRNLKTSDFVEGFSGKGIQFDGSTKYCEYPNNEKINFDYNSFSIAFWINQDLSVVDRTHSQRYIVKGSNVRNDLEGHSGKRYEVYYTPDKSIVRFCVDDDEVKSEVTADESLFLTNDWVFVVAVRDTTEKKLLLYADAKLVGEVADATGNIAQNEPLYLSYSVNENGFVNGVMDEVQLYGYALSQTQIDSLYPNSPVTVVNELSQVFHLYPNPSSGLVRVASPNNKNIKSIAVTDLMGRLLYQQSADQIAGTAIELNLEFLAKKERQMYIVAVEIEGHVFYKKLILN